MGTVFKHVADAALRSVAHEICQQCERPEVPVYGYAGTLVDPYLAANVALAQEEPEVCYLCASCIQGGNVRRSNRHDVAQTVQSLAKDPENAWQAFNQLPSIPLFLQGCFDWPFCCDSWCEFRGSPLNFPHLLATQRSHQYWEKGIGKRPRPLATQGPPESLREISVFACTSCPACYYTDQFS